MLTADTQKGRIDIRPIDIDPYQRGSNPSEDENLSVLLDNWDRYNSRLVIFLGAGASVGARNTQGVSLPAAFHLRNEIYKQFLLKPEERKKFDFRNIALMSLEHTSALAAAKSDEKSVEEFVASFFLVEKPLWSHAVLPFLTPVALFTTNYDTLVEQGWALQANKASLTKAKKIKPLDPVYSKSPNLNPNFIPLYKPHGTIERMHSDVGLGGLVLTQFDYFEMLNYRSDLLDQFMEKFNESCVLFIGYGFQDVDIAARLYNIRRNNGGPRWFAVFPRDNSDVRRMYAEKYNILQINRTFNDFMCDLDQAINFIPDEWKFDRIDDLIHAGSVLERPSKSSRGRRKSTP